MLEIRNLEKSFGNKHGRLSNFPLAFVYYLSPQLMLRGFYFSIDF